MSEKSTKAEVIQRVAVVYELLLRHAARSEIVQFGTNEWGITQRQVDKYIKRAKDLLYTATEEDLEKKKNRILHELDYLYSVALRKGQTQTCLEIKKTQAKLDGLMIDRMKVEGNIQNENHNYEHLTDDEVAREVERLVALRTGGADA